MTYNELVRILRMFTGGSVCQILVPLLSRDLNAIFPRK